MSLQFFNSCIIKDSPKEIPHKSLLGKWYSCAQSRSRNYAKMFIALLALVTGLIPLSSSLVSSPALAAAPYSPMMGVDATSIYGCQVTSDNIVHLAHALVDTGLVRTGYKLIEITDCWQTRDTSGVIAADSARFTKSIPALVHELHSLGIQLGLSLDLTTATCRGAIGSQGHIHADTATIARWGVDELSISACDAASQEQLKNNCPIRKGSLFLYPRFNQVISTLRTVSSHIMLTSMIPANVAQACGDGNTPYLQAMTYATRHAQSWRGLPEQSHNWNGFLSSYTNALSNLQYIHSRSFGTSGELAIGQHYLNAEEESGQVALWSLFGSPLILATDPARLTNDQLTVLTNSEIIHLDQTGYNYGPAFQLVADNGIDIIARQVSHNKYMAIYFVKNFSLGLDSITIPWELPEGNWTQTNIATGNSTPLNSQISGLTFGHHVTVYSLTRS